LFGACEVFSSGFKLLCTFYHCLAFCLTRVTFISWKLL